MDGKVSLDTLVKVLDAVWEMANALEVRIHLELIIISVTMNTVYCPRLYTLLKIFCLISIIEMLKVWYDQILDHQQSFNFKC